MRFVVVAASLAFLSVTLLATPPLPPPEFAAVQSPAKPPPFPVTLVDQGQFDPKFKGYFLPEGFRMEVVASEPEVINPVGITFGPDGNLFVLEWRQDPVTTSWNEIKETFHYRDGTTKRVPTMRKFVTDWVKQLKYDPATKQFGPAKPIIAEELPSSVLYHDGWLYVTGRGTVRRYRQSLPTGKWDIREVIAQGFCGFHHHQVSGLTIGNDGWLYLTSGDDDNFVEGSDGSRATVLRTGAVFRCKPDGSQMEVFSLGYRNPYRDVAFDDRFNLFHTDNDNEDGSRFMGCRIMHVAEGADFGWRLKEGVHCCRPDIVRAAIGGELPGRLPPMIKTGRGAPAGLLIYNDTYLPEQYRGLLYYPDVFRKLIRAYSVQPAGSTFKITGEFTFMKSDDPLFRPCQMITGPDGAIYICDWRTDSGGAGKLWGDGVHGRIYRVSWAGTKDTPAIALRGMDSWAKLQPKNGYGSFDSLIEALRSPNATDRQFARHEMIRRIVPNSNDLAYFQDVENVRRIFSSCAMDKMQNLQTRLTCTGGLQQLWDEKVNHQFIKLLRDQEADVRRVAAEAIGMNSKRGDEANHTALLKAIADPEPTVRRVAALALGRVAAGGVADALVNVYKSEETPDPFLMDAYVRGIERVGKHGVEAVLNLAQSGDERDRDIASRIFTAFRIRAAAEALPEMLGYPHLTVPQREALIRSYANYQFDPPISIDPLAVFLAKRPDEPLSVLQAAVEVFGTNSVTAGPTTRNYLIGLLPRVDRETRLEVIRAVENTRLKEAVPALLTMLADDRRDVPERTAILKALRVTSDAAAARTIAGLLAPTEPASLRVEALRTLAALAPAEAYKAAVSLLDQTETNLLEEAVSVLGATADGAKLIGQRCLAGKLPRELCPRVTDSLLKFNRDPEAARMRSEVLKGGLLLNLDPAQVARMANLVQTKGDPKKGKELYLNTKVLACATCHRMEGVGGYVGPDLSRVWDTQSVEKLLESILAPSKEIKEGFQTYRLVTANGQTVTGLRLLDTATEVTIRDATGRDIRVAKDDIEELTPSKLSIMPEDAVAQLTFDQFIDLLAFLKSRPQQESLRGTVSDFTLSGPTTTELSSMPADVLADSTGKAGGPWHAVSVGSNGLLDLKDVFPPKPAGLLLRTWVYSPTKQRATAALTTDSPVKVWANSAAAFEQSPDKAGLKEGTFDLDLHEGWNPVLIKLVNGGPTQRLGLRVLGKSVRTAAKPE